MRLLSLSVLVMLSLTTVAYAQTLGTFSYTILPEKMLEHSEGIIQVYELSNGIMRSSTIEDLRVRSSDISVIQIIETEKDENEFITNVRIKSLKPGIATIAIISSGFSSLEFPLTVYANNIFPTQILMKLTPDNFSLDGPKRGYVAIELATTNGLPVIATQDITISLSTSKNVVNLLDKELIINKGEYYALGQFEVKNPGTVEIYAAAENMETKSDSVTVGEKEDLTVKLYMPIEKINTFRGSEAHIIVQLQDSSGSPVVAQEDISVYLKVTGSNFDNPVNLSNLYNEISTIGYFQIPKGSYWGHTTMTTLTGIEDTYDVTISTDKPLALDTKTVETFDLELWDDKLIKFKTLPVLATGKTELIGLLYLEDKSDNPIYAERNLEIKISSSDEDSISVGTTILKRGQNSALVFGKTGYSLDDELKLLPVVDEGVKTSVTMFGPRIGSLEFVADLVIPKILADTDFPIALYLKNGEEITNFPEDSQLFISPSKYFEVKPTNIFRGSSLFLLDSKSLKDGSDALNFEINDFKSSLTLDSFSPQAAKIHLSHVNQMLPKTNNKVALQLLDKQNNPVYAKEDIEIELYSNNNKVLNVPESVIVKKGEYSKIFDVNPQNDGTAELVALAIDLPLSKFNIKVQGMIPDISINSREFTQPEDPFDFTITAEYQESPLKGMKVEWEVNGAEIQKMDSVTNDLGVASVTLYPHNGEEVSVSAEVSGTGVSTKTVSRSIGIIQPEVIQMEQKSEEFLLFDLMGINIAYFLIPVAVLVGIVLKKRNMLDRITERISFLEKLEEIKNRISQIREK